MSDIDLTDEDTAKAAAADRWSTRMDAVRNKLVQVAQDATDPRVRAEALHRIQALPKVQATPEMQRTDSGNVVDNEKFGPSSADKFEAGAGEMLFNPAKRRQAIVRADKNYSFGLLTKAGQALEPVADAVLPDSIKKNLFDTDAINPGRLASYAKSDPLSPGQGFAADVAGAVAPGSIIGKLAKLARLGTLAVPGVKAAVKAAPIIGETALGAGTAGVTDVASRTGQGLAEDGLPGAAAGAKEGWSHLPSTMALGGALGAAGGGARKIIDKSKSAKFITERGGNINTFTPPSGGPFNDPLVRQGIENGRVTESGKGTVSRAAARGVVRSLNDRVSELDTTHRDAITALEQRGGNLKPVDVTGAWRAAEDLSVNPGAPRAIRDTVTKEVLEDFAQKLKKVGTDAEGRPIVVMSAEDANVLKKKLQQFADFDNLHKTDPRFSKLSGGFREAVDTSGFEAPNDAYEAGAKPIQEMRRALEMPPDIHQKLSPAQEKTLANFISRTGQDTVTAGRQVTPELKKLMDEFPDVRRYIDSVGLLQSRGDLEFGLGNAGVGGLYKKTAGIVTRNAEPAAVRLASPALAKVGKKAPTAGRLMDALRRAAEAQSLQDTRSRQGAQP